MFDWLFGTKKQYRKGPGRGAIKPYTLRAVEAEWRTIDTLVKGGRPSQLRQALISADKTLDNVLRDKVTGETMGERLKNAPHLFEKNLYNKIWSAHKTRNALVHESGYEPPAHIMKKAINDLKLALNYLGVTNI